MIKKLAVLLIAICMLPVSAFAHKYGDIVTCSIFDSLPADTSFTIIDDEHNYSEIGGSSSSDVTSQDEDTELKYPSLVIHEDGIEINGKTYPFSILTSMTDLEEVYGGLFGMTDDDPTIKEWKQTLGIDGETLFDIIFDDDFSLFIDPETIIGNYETTRNNVNDAIENSGLSETEKEKLNNFFDGVFSGKTIDGVWGDIIDGIQEWLDGATITINLPKYEDWEDLFAAVRADAESAKAAAAINAGRNILLTTSGLGSGRQVVPVISADGTISCAKGMSFVVGTKKLSFKLTTRTYRDKQYGDNNVTLPEFSVWRNDDGIDIDSQSIEFSIEIPDIPANETAIERVTNAAMDFQEGKIDAAEFIRILNTTEYVNEVGGTEVVYKTTSGAVLDSPTAGISLQTGGLTKFMDGKTDADEVLGTVAFSETEAQGYVFDGVGDDGLEYVAIALPSLYHAGAYLENPDGYFRGAAYLYQDTVDSGAYSPWDFARWYGLSEEKMATITGSTTFTDVITMLKEEQPDLIFYSEYRDAGTFSSTSTDEILPGVKITTYSTEEVGGGEDWYYCRTMDDVNHIFEGRAVRGAPSDSDDTHARPLAEQGAEIYGISDNGDIIIIGQVEDTGEHKLTELNADTERYGVGVYTETESFISSKWAFTYQTDKDRIHVIDQASGASYALGDMGVGLLSGTEENRCYQAYNGNYIVYDQHVRDWSDRAVITGDAMQARVDALTSYAGLPSDAIVGTVVPVSGVEDCYVIVRADALVAQETVPSSASYFETTETTVGDAILKLLKEGRDILEEYDRLEEKINNGTATATDIELHEQIRMESIAAAEWLTRNADSATGTEISMLEDSGILAIACSAHGADYRTVEKVQKVLEEREDVNTGDAEEVEVEETGEDEAEEKAYTDLIEFLKSIGIDETEIPDQITIEWLREIARTYNIWNPEVGKEEIRKFFTNRTFYVDHYVTISMEDVRLEDTQSCVIKNGSFEWVVENVFQNGPPSSVTSPGGSTKDVRLIAKTTNVTASGTVVRSQVVKMYYKLEETLIVEPYGWVISTKSVSGEGLGENGMVSKTVKISEQKEALCSWSFTIDDNDETAAAVVYTLGEYVVNLDQYISTLYGTVGYWVNAIKMSDSYEWQIYITQRDDSVSTYRIK